MNTINVNNNVSFGLVFKVSTKKNGARTADALDFFEEIQLYKRLDKKLKRDMFEKTETGVRSKNFALEKDSMYPKSNALRLKNRRGEFYIADVRDNFLPAGEAYKKMRQTFDELVK